MKEKTNRQDGLDMLSEYVGDAESMYEDVNAEEDFFRNKRLDKFLAIKNVFVIILVALLLVFSIGMIRTISYKKPSATGGEQYYLVTSDYETMINYEKILSENKMIPYPNSEYITLRSYITAFSEETGTYSIIDMTQNMSVLEKRTYFEKQLEVITKYEAIFNDVNYFPNTCKQKEYISLYLTNREVKRSLLYMEKILSKELENPNSQTLNEESVDYLDALKTSNTNFLTNYKELVKKING